MAVLKPFQLSIIKTLLDNYHFEQPFSTYFAAQCKQHKNWGSKDRKTYKNACYAYFRLGFLIKKGSVESNVLLASMESEELIQSFQPDDIFPYREFVSNQIDFTEWTYSLLFLRPVYLAIKKSFTEKVMAWLDENGIAFERISNECLKVKADSKCNPLIELGWAWIMDIASQNTAGLIEIKPQEQVWDACSGAGGKSLYLTNKYGNHFNLTCSDLRLSVLENLKARFYTAGLKMPRIELADLNEPFQHKIKYDKIILDVPCSGSGTWGRSPENISTITPNNIQGYVNLQRNIVRNAIKNLANNGHVYYITCSVFRDENEGNIKYFTENFGLKLRSETYLADNYRQSDILYLAELETK